MKNLNSLNQYRVPSPFGDMGDGTCGCFVILHPKTATTLRVVASAGYYGWDHVSVSTRKRCPNWIEMCFIKDTFFEPEDCCVQYHPPQSEYVNNHPYCLHIWRPVMAGITFPMPPSILVGKKGKGPVTNFQEVAQIRAEAFLEAENLEIEKDA